MKNIFFPVLFTNMMALMVFVTVFLFPVSARCEIKAGSVEVSPFVGYNFFEDAQNLKDRPIYGARFGYNFTKNIGIEGTMEFINSRIDDRSKTGTPKDGHFRSPMDSVDLSLYHADVVYHFMPDSNFTPFVVAGFGGVHYSPSISNHDMSAFDIGIGAKYWVAENIALRVDLRDNIVSEVFPFEDAYHNVNATVGLVIAFGGGSNPQPTHHVKSESEPDTIPEQAAEMNVERTAVANTTEKVMVLEFADVHFDFATATLSEETKMSLKKMTKALKDNPGSQVRIEGYSSASGTEIYNQQLSEKRARAVEDYLIQEGHIKPERLSIIGYGEKHPAEFEKSPNNLNSDAAKANMRVLFEIIVK